MSPLAPLRPSRRGFSRAAVPAALLLTLLAPALWLTLTAPAGPAANGCPPVAAGDDAVAPRRVAKLAHRGWASFVGFSPSGRYLATGAEDGTVRVWTAEGRPVRTFRTGHDWLDPAAFDPSERYLAAAADDGTILVWSLDDGQELVVLSGHRDHLHRLAWSSDGKILTSRDNAGQVRVWHMPNGEPVRQLSSADARFSPAGDPPNRLPDRLTESFAGAPNQVLTSPDGRWTACATDRHEVRLWDGARNRLALRIDLRRSPGTELNDLESLAFSPDSRSFAAASLGREVYLWRLPADDSPRVD